MKVRVYTTVNQIETRQLMWNGHGVRAEEDRFLKRAISYTSITEEDGEDQREHGKMELKWQ